LTPDQFEIEFRRWATYLFSILPGNAGVYRTPRSSLWPATTRDGAVVAVRAVSESAAVAAAVTLAKGTAPIELLFVRDPSVQDAPCATDACLSAGSRVIIVDACAATVERRCRSVGRAWAGESLARALLAVPELPVRPSHLLADRARRYPSLRRHAAYIRDASRAGGVPVVTLAFCIALVSFFAAFQLLNAQWDVATLREAGGLRESEGVGVAWSRYWTCLVWHRDWQGLVVNLIGVATAGTLCEWFIGSRRTALLVLLAPAAVGLVLAGVSAHPGVSVGSSAIHHALQGAVMSSIAARRPWQLARWARVAIFAIVSCNLVVGVYRVVAGAGPWVVSTSMTESVGYSGHLVGAAVGACFGLGASVVPGHGLLRWLEWAGVALLGAVCVLAFHFQAGR